MTYIDKLMTNHFIGTESPDFLLSHESEHHYGQKGGDSNNMPPNLPANVPNGGFPPIYIKTQDDAKQTISKNRQFGTIKSAISIKDLLGKTIEATDKNNL